jgi:quercetin dioxygenase-like cupin family protein
MIEKVMTLLTHRGNGPAFSYAGQPMHILAGHGGQPPGFAAMEIIVPPHFAGPIPHAHDEFDEAIYVVSGHLLVIGDDEPQEATPGSTFVAPRGNRHGFSNPYGEEARVLGLWAPPEPALAFMREIGAALTPDIPPDPDRMREIYARHASRLLP